MQMTRKCFEFVTGIQGITMPGNNFVQQSSLPNHPLTSFIGREQEIAEIKRLLTTSRLLTITGTGGSGKSRLALQIATDLQGTFQHGIWWVDLANLTDLTEVLQAITSVLGIGEQMSCSLMDRPSDYLRDRKILLVLDNCEHLVTACAQLAGTLLQACQEMNILTTSREALKITGETVWLVPALRCSASPNLTLEDLMQYEATQLFIDRAKAVLPSLVLTAESVRQIAQVCLFLEGIPLAIELAAMRMNILSVEQIFARLHDCCRLLTNGSRIAPPRQQSIRTTIDWSYNLLSEKERILFHRLSVFAGRFSLDTAEVICAGGSIKKSEILDVLAHLVDKSLVVIEKRSDELQYRLQEPIRQYSYSKLQEHDEKTAAQEGYRDWSPELAVLGKGKSVRREPRICIDPMSKEDDNRGAMLQWTPERRGAEMVAQPSSIPSSSALSKRTSIEADVQPTLRIYALGPPLFYLGEQVLSSANWKYAKAEELLCYLLCHRLRTKEQIGLALWPDASSTQLRNNLHATLHHLRRALGRPEWIIFEKGLYSFNRQFIHWFDVESFETLLAQAQKLQFEAPVQAIHSLQDAITLYRGDFLEHRLTGNWYLLRQSEMRKKYVNALLALGQLFLAQGQYAQAADTYSQLIAHDRFVESAHRELMRCYALQGERSQALRHYQTLQEMMDEEFGSSPDPETMDLFQQIRDGTFSI